MINLIYQNLMMSLHTWYMCKVVFTLIYWFTCRMKVIVKKNIIAMKIQDLVEKEGKRYEMSIVELFLHSLSVFIVWES